MSSAQIKSRKRVTDHGEVFTGEREVKAMCDLVAQECDRIDSKFLEPACGDGNFLAEVLSRKLNRLKQLYKSNVYDYERYSIITVGSIYGVELLKDNAEACRKRLFAQWDAEYKKICKKSCTDDMRNAIKYIIEKNILCGNALSLMQVDDNQQDTDLPIIFPEWSLAKGAMIKRRDFRLDVLLKANTKPEKNKSKSLFDDELDKYLSINPATGEYMPEPIKIYPAVHYKRIMEIENEQ